MTPYETLGQSHLAKQSLEHTNFEQLHSLTPEVISRQATINVGTIGHVAHGKSTIVKSLSGVNTSKSSKEKEKNMTIKLGYANAKIYECDNSACPRPERYCSAASNKEDVFPCRRPGCTGQSRLIRHLSFVDCPGHERFMAAMLNGAAVMDAALLIIAANETCPQTQTAEHLAAMEIIKLSSIITLQTKIDLVRKVQAEDNYQEIRKFIQGTRANDAPVIPISAQLHYNIDAVCDSLARRIPIPIRDYTSSPRMTIIRSFDINRPGATVDDLKGGVVGGSISKGIFKINQMIEIRPGLVYETATGQQICRPLKSKITSLYAEQNELAFAVPGGLIGVGTAIDPAACRSDRLVGHIMGEVGTLPKIYQEITIRYSLLPRTFSKLTKKDVLLLNIGSFSSGGRVIATKIDLAKIQLTKPVCADIGDKIALSRRVNGSYRLFGWGEIQKGTEIEIQSDA